MKRDSGQSLLEVLIAVSVFLIVSASAVMLTSGGQDLLGDASQETQALEYAAEGVEATRAIRDAGWAGLTDGAHGLTLSGGAWQFGGASDTRDIFTRTVTVATVDPFTKIATTTVLWQTDPLRPRRVALVQILTSWQTASPTLCTLTGDWAHPRIIGGVNLGPGRQGTDVIASGTIVYISSTASDGSKKDFSVFDVTNPAAPQLLGEINTGGGINEIVRRGGYVFAVSSDDSKELVVIDVRNPSAPAEVAYMNFSGDNNANSVVYWKNYIFIGRDFSATNAELEIVDVTNPANPLLATELNSSESILKAYAFNNRLYLSHHDAAQEVSVRDITNPPAAPLVASWNIAPDDVYGMYADGDEARFMAGTDESNSAKYIDASNPAAPMVLGSTNVGGRVRDVFASANFAVVGTTNANAEFQVLDVLIPPAMRVVATINLSQLVNGISCYGNTIYAAVRSNDALQIIGPGL